MNHKDTLYLLLLRSKPKQASQRVVQKLLTFPKLVEKYKDQILGLEKRDRELQKEVIDVKKQVEDGEKRVRDMAQVIQSELTNKIKGATVKIAF